MAGSRTLVVNFIGDTSKLDASVKSTSAQMTGLQKTASRLKGALAAAGFAAVGAAMVNAAKQTIDFDRNMRNVNSIAQLSEGQFKQLEQSVLSLAGKTAQSPQTLASGLYDLESSGFNAQQSLTILGSTAKAATAGLTDTATSTKAVASVLNAYHLNASDAAKVSDTLFETVNRGVIEFPELASTIGDVLPFASSLHVPLNQIGAAVSTMTKEGISGSETMTRLKSVLQTFIKPSKDMSAAISDTGFASGEALVKAKGLQGAIEAVTKTTDGSKSAVASLFPNVRALGGALALTGGNAKSAHADLTAFQNVGGATDKALSQQAQSISYQWNKVKATFNAFSIEIGLKALPVLTSIFGWINKNRTVVEVFAGAVAGAAIAYAAWRGIPAIIDAVKTAQIALNAAMDDNPVGLIVTAIGALVGALVVVEAKTHFVEAGWRVLSSFFASAAASIRTVVVGAWNKISQVTTTVFGAVKSFFKKWWPEIVGTVFGGPLGGIVALVITHWDKVKQVTSSVFGEVRQIAASAWREIQSRIVQPIEQTVQTAAGLWRSLERGASSAWSTISKGASAFAGKIKTFVLSGIQGGLNLVIGFLNDIIGVLDKLPFVNIKKLSPIHLTGGATPGAKSGSNSGSGQGQGLYEGGLISRPMVMLGEEAPKHHEYVLATNPAYRQRNLGLWAKAGKDLGVPGFAEGGVVGEVDQFFTAAGFNKTAIAGLLGNAMQESTMNPDTPGGGLWQQISNFGSGTGGSLLNQMQTMLPQIMSLRDAMNTSGSPAAAAAIFVNQFERPASWAANIPKREQYAQQFYGQLTGGGGGGGFLSSAGSFAKGVAANALGAALGPLGMFTVGQVQDLIKKLPSTSILPDWLTSLGSTILGDAKSFLNNQVLASGGTRTGPGAANPQALGGTGSGAYQSGLLAPFDGHQVATWIIPELLWARAHGWSGAVTSGWRSPTEVVHGVYATAPQGKSEHQYDIYPHGAVDVSDYQQFAAIIRSYPGQHRLIQLSIDPLHFSGTGHYKGGVIGRVPGLAQGGMIGKGGPLPFSTSDLNTLSTRLSRIYALDGGDIGLGIGPAGATTQISAQIDWNTNRWSNDTIFPGPNYSSISSPADFVIQPADRPDGTTPPPYIAAKKLARVHKQLAQVVGWENTWVKDLQRTVALSRALGGPINKAIHRRVQQAEKIRKRVRANLAARRKLEEQIKAAKKKIDDAQKRITKLKQQITDARDKISKANDRIRSATSDLKTEKAKKPPYSKPKTAAQRDANQKFAAQQTKRISTLQDKINTDTGLANGLEHDITRWKGQITGTHDRITGLRADIKGWGEKVRPIEAQNRQLAGQPDKLLADSTLSQSGGGELGEIVRELGTPEQTSALQAAIGTGSSSTGLYSLQSVVSSWPGVISGTGGQLAQQKLALAVSRRQLAALNPGAKAALKAQLQQLGLNAADTTVYDDTTASDVSGAVDTTTDTSTPAVTDTTAQDLTNQLLSQQLAEANVRAQAAEAMLKANVNIPGLTLPGFAKGGIPFAGWFAEGGDVTASVPTLIGIGDGPRAETASIRDAGDQGGSGGDTYLVLSGDLAALDDFIDVKLEKRERKNVRYAKRGAGGGIVRPIR